MGLLLRGGRPGLPSAVAGGWVRGCDFEHPDVPPSWGEKTLVVFYHHKDILNSNYDFQGVWLGWHSHIRGLDLMTPLPQAAVMVLRSPT